MDKFYLTTPIYYASGQPHIGHAFTTIYADIISRFHKAEDKNVWFVTGMDEHGSKVAQNAEALKKSPQKFVDEISKNYADVWQALNIQYDDFIRTTSERHKQGINEFLKRIYDAGDIYEADYEGLYCVDCEKFLTEKDLVNGCCPDHLKPPQKLKERNYFFNLKKYLPKIQNLIKKNELRIMPETRRNEILSMIDSGIPDFSISREKVKWGIPFPYDKNQTVYVWVEALMNYVTVLNFPDGDKFKKYWPADLHLIGAEINKFHSIFWPALLLSAKLPLPERIFVHGLFTVNGRKMGKTLGNVIDPVEMIQKFGIDATRYLLVSQFPAMEHGDIKASEFASKYNDDLAKGLGNFFERIFTMIVDFGIDIDGKKVDRDIKELAMTIDEDYKKYFYNYNIFEGLRMISVFVKKIDQYINDKAPWKLKEKNSGELIPILSTLFFATGEVCRWIKPVMPGKAAEIENYSKKIKNRKITKGGKIGLFPRI